MELKFSKALFIFLFFTLKCRVSCVGTIIVTYQILHQHPKLRACAEDILKENRFAGGRVSIHSGECQGLLHVWTRNQTIEPGFAYAKKLMVQETFHPPIGVTKSGFNWTIPSAFDTGASLTIYVTVPEDDYAEFDVKLQDEWVVYNNVTYLTNWASSMHANSPGFDSTTGQYVAVFRGKPLEIVFKSYEGLIQTKAGDGELELKTTPKLATMLAFSNTFETLYIQNITFNIEV